MTLEPVSTQNHKTKQTQPKKTELGCPGSSTGQVDDP